jgi:transketolase
VVARTVRGKGLPSIEARADRWFANFTAEEVAGLLAELHGGPSRGLASEGLVVR